MANIKSAKKRIEVARNATLRNKSRRSEVRTYIRKFEEAVDANEVEAAKELLPLIDKKLKNAAHKGAMSENAASRKLSQLQRKLNSLNA